MSIARWMDLHDTECDHALPVCKHDGCTGASVSAQWSPFCSQLCAALWALEQTQIHQWCIVCHDWCTADDCLFVNAAEMKKEVA